MFKTGDKVKFNIYDDNKVYTVDKVIDPVGIEIVTLKECNPDAWYFTATLKLVENELT